ncbi:S8 family serine peptidase [Streptomyces sp. NPDC051940]|uniref:S8 family serine peptidase n=1 Tax=Streptomyces sp. NPDC051940 TaxID=3155675 RepID=UPI003449BE78
MKRPLPWRRTAAAAAAAVVFATGAPAAADDDGSAVPLTAADGGRSVSVTLITGDVVDARVGAGGTVLSAALRAADGTDATATTWRDGRITYVFPEGVEKLVDGGLLDADLFDVGKLVASGYDDASSDRLPVIVEYAGGRLPRTATAGAERTAVLESIGGAGLGIGKRQAKEVWGSLRPSAAKARETGGVRKIWLDEVVRGTAAPDLGTPTVPLTGAPAAYAAGLDGSGVKVAVLDTGVDTAHPDLAGRVAASKSFVYGQAVEDLDGHGTHTATTVAGTGAASDGRYAGVAPGADLLVGKVLGNDGSGSTSGIIQGMEWAVAEGASVVSMSLGSAGATSCAGPDVDAVQRLSDRALFVIAAGNASLRGTVSTPGCAPAALTVGALDRTGATAPFSSRGPSADGVSAKPDIASQGVAVVAARAGGRGELAYTTMSGTSMATPHVAGGAALLAQQHPDATPAELKELLTSSAAGTDTPVLEQGAGPMDLARAISQPVTAAPGRTLGDFAYPQSGLEPVAKTVTLTNRSGADVTLDLAVEDVRGDDGTPLAGFAEAAAGSVTVPAGGTAEAAVRIDPSVKLPLGAYGTVTGRLVGTADGARVTVPFGVRMEVPSANLTVRGLDRHGDPAADPSTFQLFDDHRDTARRYTLGWPAAGSTTIRVPFGTYAVSGVIMTRDEPGNVGSVASVSQVYEGGVTVDGDTTVGLDARDATEITWDTDRPSEPRGFAMGLGFALDDSRRLMAGYLQSIPSLTKAVYAQPVSGDERLTFMASARLAAPGARLTTSAGRVLDAVPLQKGTEFDGEGTAEVVYIGKGTDANFAAHDLKGRIVLLDAGTGGGNGLTWSRAAKTAGAVGVLAAVPGTVGRFQTTGEPGVPQYTVTWPDSQALQAELAQGPATVSFSGTATARSPYLYNLAYRTQGGVAAGEQRVHDGDLAVRDARYHVQGTDTTYWSDVQTSVPGMGAVWTGGTPLQIAAPQRRTEFFTASSDLGWTSSATRGIGTTYGISFDGPHLMSGKAVADWFKTPYGPVRNTYSAPLMTRDANRLSYTIAPFGDAGGHDATSDRTDSGYRRLLLNGEPQAVDSGVYVLPQEDAEVTLQQAWRRPPSALNRVGLAYTTEWTFRTGAADQGVQPLLVPVVDVPSDLRNRVPAGVETSIPLGATGDAGPVGLASVRLEYAYGDQSTAETVTGWHAARVVRSGAGWQAKIPGGAPAGAFVHLRVTMADADGSRVVQTVVRAYEVA